MKIAFKVIFSLILIGILAVGVYFIGKHTGWFSTSFKTFYVERNGEAIMKSEDIKLTYGEKLTLKVKYTFEDIDASLTGYSIKIKPNLNNDFVYTLEKEDGTKEHWRFSDTVDYTEYFSIKIDESEFTLNGKFTVESILFARHGGGNIKITTEKLNLEEALFVLSVYEKDEKNSFDLGIYTVRNVESLGFELGEASGELSAVLGDNNDTLIID